MAFKNTSEYTENKTDNLSTMAFETEILKKQLRSTIHLNCQLLHMLSVTEKAIFDVVIGC